MSRSLGLHEFLRASSEAFNPVLLGSSILGRAQMPLSPSKSINAWEITVPARNLSSYLLTMAKKKMESVGLFLTLY